MALNLLNFKLADGTYAIPSPQTIINAGTRTAIGFSAFSFPARFRENQALGNLDYIINSNSDSAVAWDGSIIEAPATGRVTEACRLGRNGGEIARHSCLNFARSFSVILESGNSEETF